MSIDTKDLEELAKRVLTDRLFCGDENHRALATGVESLLAENEALRKNADRYLWLREHHWLCEKDVDSKIAAWNAPKQVQP